jgi:hypothetical protein
MDTIYITMTTYSHSIIEFLRFSLVAKVQLPALQE